VNDSLKVAAWREGAAALCVLCADGLGVEMVRGRWFHPAVNLPCDAGAMHHLIAANQEPEQPDPRNGQHRKNQEKRVAIYRCLVKFNQDLGIVPSYREIAHATGITSTSVVAFHLRKMEKANLIERAPYSVRAIRLVRPLRYDYAGDLVPTGETLQPCGHPTWAITQAEEGTAHCWVCELVARVGQVGVNRLAEFYCDKWRGM